MKVDIVAAVLMAFMEERPFWKGTEKQLYDELTRFKDDPMNEIPVIRAIVKLKGTEHGGFSDVTPLMLEKLRKAAHEQAKLNTYTWIAPGHVLALLAAIDELEAALADTTARAIRTNLTSED